MPYLIPSYSTLQSQVLADIQNSNISVVNGSPLPTSILYFLGMSQANQSYSHYQYIAAIAQQCTPFTATQEYLEAWAGLRGVTRKLPTSSTGSIALASQGIVNVPSGTILVRPDGVQFTTTSQGNTGTALPITCSTPGSTGNSPLGTTLTLFTPIAGVNSSASLSAPTTGGTDTELDPSFRTRMLAAYSEPASGGTQTDFTNWALSAPGVTRAFANGNGAGNGSVVIYPFFDDANHTNGLPVGENGAAALESRYATAIGDQLTVANTVYPLSPVTSLVIIVSAIPIPVNVTISGLNTTLAVQQAISTNLTNVLLQQGTPLGTQIFLPTISNAIQAASGSTSFQLVSPTNPISLATGFIPVLGSVSYQ